MGHSGWPGEPKGWTVCCKTVLDALHQLHQNAKRQHEQGITLLLAYQHDQLDWSDVVERGVLRQTDCWQRNTEDKQDLVTKYCKKGGMEGQVNEEKLVAQQDEVVEAAPCAPTNGFLPEKSSWTLSHSDEDEEIWELPDPPPCYYKQLDYKPAPLSESAEEDDPSAHKSELTRPPLWPPAKHSQRRRKAKRKVVKSKPDPSGKKLFIKNINFDSSQRDLWDFFLTFGPVRRCSLLKDERKRSRGLGFVTFESCESAAIALSVTPEELYFDGRNLQVEPALRQKYSYSSVNMDESIIETPDIPVEDKYASMNATCPDSLSGDCTVPPVATRGLSIDIFDDMILLKIFSYLSIREWLKLESVCKRWQWLSIKSWNGVRHLDFRNVCHRFGGLSDFILRRLLRRVKYLKSLDVSCVSRYLTDKTMNNISKLCPNLTRLDISGSSISNKGLEKLVGKCSRIEDITLRNCHNIGEKGFWWLFHVCRELRTVNISNPRITGSCLHMVRETSKIHTLNLSHCSNLQDVALEKLGMTPDCIQELHLDRCIVLTDRGIRALTQNCRSLKRLHLTGYYTDVTSAGLMDLRRLWHLEELYVQENLAVDNGVLTALGQCCHRLRVLNITCCNSDIDSEGVAALAQCPFLEDLRISYLYQVDDAGLNPIISNGVLRSLVAASCTGLGDATLEALGCHSNNLELVDVSGCRNVTSAGVQSLIDSKQDKPKTLRIVVGGTEAEETNIVNNEAVEVMWVNHSVTTLERDNGFFLYTGSDDSDYDFDEPSYGMGNQAGLDPAEAEEFLDHDDPLLEERFFPS